MTKARDIASATTPNANAALLATFPHRNLIINGAMQVAQRGTTYSHNPNTGGYHTVDRYSYRRAGTWSGITAVELSQESTGGPDGFTNYLRYAPTGSDATTASDTAMYIDYKIEGNVIAHLGLGSSAAQPFTLSFYVRSSVTGTFSLSARDSATSNWTKYITEYTINSANTWERKTITFPAVTTGTFYKDYLAGMTLMWTLSADSASSTYATSSTNTWLSDANDTRWSTNQTDAFTTTSGNTFDITGVQLELGSTATPFEHRSYGDELAKCQRYACKLMQFNANKMREFDRYRTFSYVLPVEMRATPTVPSMTTTDGIACTIGNATSRGFVVSSVAPSDGYTAYVTSELVVTAEL